MKSAGQHNETDNQTGAPVDPFAVDFFGGATSPVDEEPAAGLRPPRIRRRRGSDWARSLPRLTNAEAGFSYALAGFSAGLTGAACDAVADVIRSLTNGADEVRCRVVSVVETALAETLRRESAGRTAIELAAGKGAATIIVDSAFAGAFVDSLLGGETESGEHRMLTPTETAVIEFVGARIASALNKLGGRTSLVLREVGTARPETFRAGERGAEIVVEIETGSLAGIVSVLAAPEFMHGLGAGIAALPESTKFADAEVLAREVGLFLDAGSTLLDAGSLAFLEPDDIVIIDRPRIVSAESFAGAQTVRVGRGGNFRLRGTIVDTIAGAALTVGEIISDTARRKFTPAKFMMDEFANDQTDENGFESDGGDAAKDSTEELAPALENIQVALRVEIAGNRISLRELQDLRPGQIIGLGCSPTDPVRLVTDSGDEPVATGELVEIEGQLGVRLTKVFV